MQVMQLVPPDIQRPDNHPLRPAPSRHPRIIRRLLILRRQIMPPNIEKLRPVQPHPVRPMRTNPLHLVRKLNIR